ncbi:MAG: MarR family winged helix-turn-helix transcriptional regulator [Deltaproteobacteria bacterium]
MKRHAGPESRCADEARLEAALGRIRDSSRRYGKVDPLTAETFLGFLYTHSALSARLERMTRAHGITRPGINVLTILRGSEGESCNQQTLSRLLLVSRANVTGLVDGLARKGLVLRAADARDRRARQVRITPKGQRLLDAILPLYHARVAALFSGWSCAEKKYVNRLMAKLRAALAAPEKRTSR